MSPGGLRTSQVLKLFLEPNWFSGWALNMLKMSCIYSKRKRKKKLIKLESEIFLIFHIKLKQIPRAGMWELCYFYRSPPTNWKAAMSNLNHKDDLEIMPRILDCLYEYRRKITNT